MALADQIPEAGSFTDLLTGLIGDEHNGLAGMLSTLETNDLSNLSELFLSQLTGLLGVELPEDTTALIQAPLTALPQLLSSIPADSSEITGGMVDGFAQLRQTFSGDLLGGINQLLESLTNIQNLAGQSPEELIPFDPGSILDDTATTILEFLSRIKEKAEELSGGFLEIDLGGYNVETWFTSYAYSFISGIESYFGRDISQLFEKFQLQCQNILDPAAIRQIQTLRDKCIASYVSVKTKIAAGETGLQEELAKGHNTLVYLRNHLANRIASVQTALGREQLGADHFKSGLTEAYNQVLQNALLEISGFKERFNRLFEDIAGQVESIQLDEIGASITSLFETLNSSINALNLHQLRQTLVDPLNRIKESIQSLKDQVLYVVVDVTNVLTQFRDAVSGLTSQLGQFDAEGRFHYAFEASLNELLNTLSTNLTDTVQPAISEFSNTTLGGVFNQLQTLLTPAAEAVEGVRNELAGLLQSLLDALGGLDITSALTTAQEELDAMLDRLAPIEFDPITAPVIAEIENMEEELRQIDVSSLNELTRAALQVAVEVFAAIDFDGQIKSALMDGMDTILNYPKEAMAELVDQVETIKGKLDVITPDLILKPLSDLYAPVRDSLEAISIEEIAAPLSDWQTALSAQLERFAPTQLLQPLVTIYEDIFSGFDRVNPSQLIAPIQSAMEEVVSFFEGVDLSTVTAPLTQSLQTIQTQVAALNPSNLLNPLVEGFQAIQEQMNRYNPAVLLAPVDAIVDSILERIEDLPQNLLAILQGALSSFAARIERISPAHIFERLTGDCAYVHGLLTQLNPQQLVADLYDSYQEMKSAYRDAGISDTPADALIESLNPLTLLAELNVGFQALEDNWQAWQAGFEAGDLTALHDNLRPKLQEFLPLSDPGALTFDFITTFLEENKPSSFLGGLTTLYETLQSQLGALNPQRLADNLQTSFDTIQNTFAQLDLSAIAQEVNGVFDEIKEAVADIDLQIIADELDHMTQDVRALLAALDPGALAAPLEALWNNVVSVLAQIDPQALLAPLAVIIEPLKDGINAFDPAGFAAPLNSIFDEIKRIIDEIDVRVVLQPLTDKLDELRDELDEELTKVGQAFEEMVRAVPV